LFHAGTIRFRNLSIRAAIFFQLRHVARVRREVSIVEEKGDREVALPYSHFGIGQLTYLQDQMLDKQVVQIGKEFVRGVLQKLAL